MFFIRPRRNLKVKKLQVLAIVYFLVAIIWSISYFLGGRLWGTETPILSPRPPTEAVNFVVTPTGCGSSANTEMQIKTFHFEVIKHLTVEVLVS